MLEVEISFTRVKARCQSGRAPFGGSGWLLVLAVFACGSNVNLCSVVTLLPPWCVQSLPSPPHYKIQVVILRVHPNNPGESPHLKIPNFIPSTWTSPPKNYVRLYDQLPDILGLAMDIFSGGGAVILA